MWVYIQTESGSYGDLFTVGFYDPEGAFQPDSDHKTREDAAKRVAYLNGK